MQYNVQGNLQNTLLIDCGIPQRELEPMTPPWFELLFPVLKWVFFLYYLLLMVQSDFLRLTSPGMWLRNPLQNVFKVWVSNNSTNVLRSFVVSVVINRGTQRLLTQRTTKNIWITVPFFKDIRSISSKFLRFSEVSHFITEILRLLSKTVFWKFWYRGETSPRIFYWKYCHSDPCPWTVKWSH